MISVGSGSTNATIQEDDGRLIVRCYILGAMAPKWWPTREDVMGEHHIDPLKASHILEHDRKLLLSYSLYHSSPQFANIVFNRKLPVAGLGLLNGEQAEENKGVKNSFCIISDLSDTSEGFSPVKEILIPRHQQETHQIRMESGRKSS